MSVYQLSSLHESVVATLTDTLTFEARAIEDLTELILKQRSAIATDDVQTVDDTVFGTHRALLVLDESKQRRTALYKLLGYDDTTSVLSLEDTLDIQETAPLRAAREQLTTAAQRLSREITVNREALRQALEQGDQQIRILAGIPSDVALTATTLYDVAGNTATPTDSAFSRTA